MNAKVIQTEYRTESYMNEMLLNLPDENFTLHTHSAIVFLACSDSFQTLSAAPD